MLTARILSLSFLWKKIVNCPFEVQTRYSINNVPIKINNIRKKKKRKELLSPLKGKKILLSKEKKKGIKKKTIGGIAPIDQHFLWPKALQYLLFENDIVL